MGLVGQPVAVGRLSGLVHANARQGVGAGQGEATGLAALKPGRQLGRLIAEAQGRREAPGGAGGIAVMGEEQMEVGLLGEAEKGEHDSGG